MAHKFSARDWLTQTYRPLEVEKETLEFWEQNGIQDKLKILRRERNNGILGYVEGPPTLNGYQHVGHARGRAIKDLWYRWRTMQGYYVPFRAGWDCQGLPVELEVEKELGVKGGKKQLLAETGEARFVEECKKTIMKYYGHWKELDKKMGIFIDHGEAYWTYSDSYIEREWRILKRAWKEGLLGEGYRVVAYCPYCQTSLSNAEVGLGYEDVEDPSLYFKFKIRGSDNEFLVIWTTMPFTIVTDLMVAVHPGEEYAKVKVEGEKWILARARVEPIFEKLGVKDYKIVETFPGKNLQGIKYDYPLLDLIPRQRELDAQDQVHAIILEDFVDVTTATGVVHLSPGNGEDDFLAAQSRGVPIFVPFDDEGNFTKDAGAFAKLFARDADARVVDELRRKKAVLLSDKVRHEYPLCWRSRHKLIWLARREYFLWTDRINEKILRAAEKVNYFFDPGRNRFLSYLKESKPWCVSRERVWGAPLPIWACQKCGSKRLMDSKDELLGMAIQKPTGYFELHKPWIDRIELRCEKCGQPMKREPFVLDAWHNSGAAPYASFTDEEVEEFVPVSFLVEGIDQTRGWANSLLLEHVIRTGQPESPYKAFLFYGLVLDEKGNKMSKSLGNVVETSNVLKTHPADIYRLYLLWKAAPIEPMAFSYKEMMERPFQIMSTLYNLSKFFLQNSEYDKFQPRQHSLDWANGKEALEEVDRWLLSKLQGLKARVTENFEKCEFHLALSAIEEYVIETLSRNYVPMIRKRLWSDDPGTLNTRLATYATIWESLRTALRLLNPVTPFLCEDIYQKVFRTLSPDLPESINFEPWPTPEPQYNDEDVEKRFEILSTVLNLANSARQSAKLKRRWPLRKAIVLANHDIQAAVKSLEELFLELANVKELEYAEASSPTPTTGFAEAATAEVRVLITTERDETLIGEGLMRDLARRIQALRKELGFLPTDVLEKVTLAELDVKDRQLIEPFLSTLVGLVRAREVELLERRKEGEWRRFDVDGRVVYVLINK